MSESEDSNLSGTVLTWFSRQICPLYLHYWTRPSVSDPGKSPPTMISSILSWIACKCECDQPQQIQMRDLTILRGSKERLIVKFSLNGDPKTLRSIAHLLE